MDAAPNQAKNIRIFLRFCDLILKIVSYIQFILFVIVNSNTNNSLNANVKTNSNIKIETCHDCEGQQDRKNCKFRDAICRNCKKKGNFAKVCRYKKNFDNKIFQIAVYIINF